MIVPWKRTGGVISLQHAMHCERPRLLRLHVSAVASAGPIPGCIPTKTQATPPECRRQRMAELKAGAARPRFGSLEQIRQSEWVAQVRRGYHGVALFYWWCVSWRDMAWQGTALVHPDRLHAGCYCCCQVAAQVCNIECQMPCRSCHCCCCAGDQCAAGRVGGGAPLQRQVRAGRGRCRCRFTFLCSWGAIQLHAIFATRALQVSWQMQQPAPATFPLK